MNKNNSSEKEKAFELLASINSEYISNYLLNDREDKLRNHKPLFLNEDKLKEWFVNHFQKWFIVHKDVEGKGYVNKKEFKLIADFILEPKEELKSQGITSYFGVEVKHIKTDKKFLTQLNQLSFQTLSYSYSNSEWFLNNQHVTTDGFFIFTNLSFAKERVVFDSLDNKYGLWWQANLALINHANVGEFRINIYKGELSSWYIHFSGSNYCKWNEESGITLQNSNVIGKYKIGNIKSNKNN